MRYLLILASLLMFACSSESGEAPDDSVLLDAAQTPMDKAGEVEDIVLESRDKIDAAVDDSGD